MRSGVSGDRNHLDAGDRSQRRAAWDPLRRGHVEGQLRKLFAPGVPRRLLGRLPCLALLRSATRNWAPPPQWSPELEYRSGGVGVRVARTLHLRFNRVNQVFTNPNLRGTMTARADLTS